MTWITGLIVSAFALLWLRVDQRRVAIAAELRVTPEDLVESLKVVPVCGAIVLVLAAL